MTNTRYAKTPTPHPLNELASLRRRVRALLGLCLLSLAVTVWSVARPRRAEHRTRGADGSAEQLRQQIDEAGYARGLRLVQQLARTRGPRAEGALIDLLHHARSDRLREEAIAQLGRVGSGAAVDALATIVAEGARGPQLKAIAALGEIGSEEAVEQLVALLETDAEDLHRAATAALGAAGGELAERALLKLARSGGESVRLDAVAALGSTASDDAVRALAGLLKERSPGVRAAAVRALGRAATAEAKQQLLVLAQQSGELRAVAIEALAGFASDDVQRLLGSLAQSKDRTVAQAALRSLAESDTELARQALLKAARESDESEPFMAEALARTGGPEARQLLVKMLRGGPMRGAYQAASALASMKDPEARRELLAAARSHAEGMHHAALYALGSLRGADVDAALREVAARGTGNSAATALLMLSRRQGKEAMPLLLAAYQDGGQAVRDTAIRAIAELDPVTNRQLLLDAARSDSYVAHGAIEALAAEGGPQAIATLVDLYQNGSNSTRGAAAHMLGRQGGDEARRVLIQDLQKERSGWTALSALRQMRDPETVAQLERLLTDPSASASVRQRALDALGDNGTPEVLRRVAEGEGGLARAALHMLAMRGGPEVEATLQQGLRAADKEKRSTALQLIARNSGPKTVETLAASLRDKDVFSTALAGLESVGGKRAMDALGDHFRSADAQQRREIAQAVGGRCPRSKALLLTALEDRDEEVSLAAARNLAQSGDGDAQQRMLAMLQSSSPTKRRELAGLIRQTDDSVYARNKQLVDSLADAGDTAGSPASHPSRAR